MKHNSEAQPSNPQLAGGEGDQSYLCSNALHLSLPNTDLAEVRGGGDDEHFVLPSSYPANEFD